MFSGSWRRRTGVVLPSLEPGKSCFFLRWQRAWPRATGRRSQKPRAAAPNPKSVWVGGDTLNPIEGVVWVRNTKP